MFDMEIVEPSVAPVAEAPAPVATPVVDTTAAELAQVKADYEALKAKVEAPALEELPAAQQVDYFLDPQGAIDSAVARGVNDALAAREAQTAKINAQAKIVGDAHPDAAEVDASAEFKAFLAVNPALAQTYAAARKNLDGATLSNALDMYKKLAQPKPTSAPVNQETVNLGDSAGAGAQGGQVFSRTQIQNMIATNPSKYDALSAEITQAYIDGRVTG